MFTVLFAYKISHSLPIDVTYHYETETSMKILHGHYSVINLCFTNKITLKKLRISLNIHIQEIQRCFHLVLFFSRFMDELIMSWWSPDHDCSF